MKNYSYLNLQQKLCKVRKKLPALVKKRYSDKVDYEFTKIDDIYRFLAPALNKYGVNFEILSESATSKDTAENPVYLRQENGMWVYEGNLMVAWINADNPEEREKAVIHLIGTHEMPEKAKGAAWTYALKYYLANKFNIDQGADDSDLTDGKPVPDKTESTEINAVKNAPAKETAAAKDGRKAVSQEPYREQPKPKRDAASAKEKVAENVRTAVKNNVQETARPDRGKDEENPFSDEEEAFSDGFRLLKEGEETPFAPASEEKEDSFMDDVFEEAEKNTPITAAAKNDARRMQVEEARKVICKVGTAFAGKTMGEVMDAGAAGRKVLDWIVRKYTKDAGQVNAAGILLEEMDSMEGTKAA